MASLQNFVYSFELVFAWMRAVASRLVRGTA